VNEPEKDVGGALIELTGQPPGALDLFDVELEQTVTGGERHSVEIGGFQALTISLRKRVRLISSTTPASWSMLRPSAPPRNAIVGQ